MIRASGIKVGDTVVLTNKEERTLGVVQQHGGFIGFEFLGKKLDRAVILRKATQTDILQFRLTNDVSLQK